MIPLIDRKHVRDLWAIRGRILALCLIIASGIGMYLAINLAISDLRNTQNDFLDRMNFADLEIAITPEDTQNLPRFSGISGIAAFDQRLVYPAEIIRDKSGLPLAGLAIFQSGGRPLVNRYEILEGRDFRVGAREMVVDRSLAFYHGYHVGDRIRLKIGKRMYDNLVTGIVLSPEFVISTANPDYVVAKPGSLGVVWSDIGQVTDAIGFKMVDSLLFRFTRDAQGDAARATVLRMISNLDVQRVTPRSESYSVKMVSMNVTAFSVYSPAIVLTLCTLAFAMGVITFRRFGIEKRSDFAILLSIGIGRRAIAASLMRIGAAIGLGGGLIGFGFGVLLGRAFGSVYATAMHLPIIEHTVGPWSFAQAVLLGVVCGVLSITVAIVPMLERTPRHLLQSRSPERAGVSTASLDWLPLPIRYSLRSLLRDRARTIAAIGAMSFSIAVAISYGLAMTSTLSTVEENFGVEKWTHAIDFDFPLYGDDARTALGSSASRAEVYLRGSVVLRAGVRQEIAQMAGIQVGGALRRQAPSQGRELASGGEVVLSSDLARGLGVGLGSSVRLEKNTEMRESRVVGITNDHYLQTVTLPIADARALAQADDKSSGAFIVASKDAGATLILRENVARVTEKADLLSFFSREMEGKLGIVYIAILFSVGTSILFVSTLVYLGILESRADYAVLRSLGFKLRQITAIILVGVIVQVGLAVAIGLPLSVLIATMLNTRMAEAWFAVRLHAAFGDFLWPIVAVLPVAPLVGWLGARAVMKLNIPAFLRERSI